MLPARCAELLLMFGMAVCSCLLVIRVLKRIVGAVPLATVSLACAAYLIGATAPYLWFRTNFYSIPFAASLLLAAWGLWLWLGAERGDGTLVAARGRRRRMHRRHAGVPAHIRTHRGAGVPVVLASSVRMVPCP